MNARRVAVVSMHLNAPTLLRNMFVSFNMELFCRLNIKPRNALSVMLDCRGGQFANGVVPRIKLLFGGLFDHFCSVKDERQCTLAVVCPYQLSKWPLLMRAVVFHLLTSPHNLVSVSCEVWMFARCAD